MFAQQSELVPTDVSLSLSIIRFDPQAVRMRQTEQELDMINCWNLCKINYDMNDDDALLNRYGICARTCLPPFQNSATAYSLFYMADLADFGIDATSGT